MSGPVDVRFVMLRDAIHADAYRESHGMSLEDFRACNMDSRDARAAVAELIEAAAGVTWFDWCDNDDDAVRSVERLRSALANMGDAK